MSDRQRVAVALGSNLGDRTAHLEYAIGRLRVVLSSCAASTLIETEPEGVGDQPRFLNGAVTGFFASSPQDLLAVLHAIERERGRARPAPGAARTLDLDLILFGSLILRAPDLVVPHPRFRERLFVLRPLAEIAPDLVDPVSGLRIRELLALRLRAPGEEPVQTEGP